MRLVEKIYIIILIKISPIKIYKTERKKKINSRINNNLADKTNTSLNPEIDQVIGLDTKTFDVCRIYFHRFKDTCVLAQLHEFDIQRFKMSQYKEYLHELNQGDIEFPMKIKEIPTFEQLFFKKNLSYLRQRVLRQNLLTKTLMKNN